MARRRGRGARESVSAATWILASVGGLILATVIYFGIKSKMDQVALDPATGCPQAPKHIVAVLVDLTDSLTPLQSSSLKNALLKIKNEVPKYGRLEVYPLRPTTQSTIAPLFEGCNPGSGRDVTSEITGNSAMADRLWTKGFGTKVDRVIDQLATIQPQETSPVLEGLQSVAVTAFGRPEAASAETRKLIVVSDMLHHTPGLSMYQGAPVFEEVKDQQYLRSTRPSLRGADVDVYLVVRATRRDAQQPPLYKFWVDLFGYSDGYLKAWEPLQ
jgi:hypothetical protein